MPEMDGFEATQEIRKMEEGSGRRTPIVAMTAYAMREDLEKCKQAGMDGHISKPIRSAKLYDIISGLLARTRLGKMSLPDIHYDAVYSNKFIDTDQLAFILDDIEQAKEIFDAFFRSYPALMQAALDLNNEGNFSQSARKYHELKGTMLNLFIGHGIDEVTMLMSKITELDQQQIITFHQSLEQKLKEVENYLRERYYN